MAATVIERIDHLVFTMRDPDGNLIETSTYESDSA
jgi:hypothetical protein